MPLIRLIGGFKYLLLLMCLLKTFQSWAQIENIPISEEVNVDRLYVGLLTYSSFSRKESKDAALSSIQLGTRATLWLTPEKLRIRSFGGLKISQDQTIQFFQNYELIYNIPKNLELHVGTMATPTTELRPHPITWQSQVETQAERNILGGRPGAKIKYSFNKDLSLSYGIHNHGDEVVQHLKIVYHQLAFSSYFEDNRLSAVLKWKFNKGNLLVSRIQNKTALSSIIPISKNYRLYLDMEYPDNTKRLTYGEWGIRRYFQNSSLIKGFFSLSYHLNSKRILGVLFIHI